MKLPKHHYIPVFYLKNWGRSDGRIVEFSRPYESQVKPRRTHPSGTGYVRGLYRLPGVIDSVAEAIEAKFMKAIDDAASSAHQKLLAKDLESWSVATRSAWSRFIIALLIRSPRSVMDVKARMSDGFPDVWDRLRETLLRDSPNSKPLGDYDHTALDRSSILALQRFIDNPKIGTFLNNMNWSVLDVSSTKFRFLTSDRPIVMTNGLGIKNGHLALPISPTMVFLATVSYELAQEIHAMPAKDVVQNCNKQVVRNAIKYVWARDESQSAFIGKHMSADAQRDRTFFGNARDPQKIELAPLLQRLKLDNAAS